MTKPNISEALSWDELADLYPGRARIRPMEDVFEWAEKQTDRFYVCPDKDTIHLIIEETDPWNNYTTPS